MSATLALTMGDFNGVGPEIILKSAHLLPVGSVVFGSTLVFERVSAQLGIAMRNDIRWHDTVSVAESDFRPGHLSAIAGEVAMACIRAAVRHCLDGHASAMVTAPLSKQAIALAGYDVPGHTEYLQQLTASRDVGMILASDGLRVGLVTIHLALSSIFTHITKDNVLHHIVMMHNALRRDFGIDAPKIAVLGLNPHAGDGGVLGKEEITVIAPAVRESHVFGINATGPFAADGFFGNRVYESYDGVLAMYHDQGLAPFKTLAFHNGVNITIGLPIVRTSPDHGTAFAIAGKGIASAASFQSAIHTSLHLASNRS